MTEEDSPAAFVDLQRAEIRELLHGVSEEQARRSLVSSLTTLLGLVKHATFVERVWAEVLVEGRSRADAGVPDDVDSSFVLTDDDTIGSILADYDDAVARARTILAAYDLDHAFVHPHRGPVTLRWILLHLIRELARHAGHGDILREQILATDAP